MKNLLLLSLSLLISTTAFSQGTSLLDKSVSVTGFGQIRYREPLNPLPSSQPAMRKKFPILLVHGIYGGASHRTWRQLLPLLDAAGESVYIVDLPGVGESDRP